VTIGIDARMYRSSVAGIGRYSQNLIKNLLEIDKKNRYVFFMTSDDIKEVNPKSEIRNQKHKIVEVDIPHYSLAEQTKMPDIIAKEYCDLMVFLNTNYPVRYRGKFIVVIHDLTLYFFPKTARKTGFLREKAFNFVLKSAVKKSTKIITDSENTQNDILKVFHPNPKKIVVIKLAADDKTFVDASEKNIERIKNQFKIDTPMILYVGQFRAHKNIAHLVKAFDIIRKKTPAKLVLVGKPDPNYQELVETIDKSPYKSDIIMPGFVSDEDLTAWYRIATCYVFPSLYEGFGLPGLEAMMAKTAVVSSNHSSLPEIYGEAALYFNPEKPDEMAEKIERVLTDENLRQSLIKKGSEMIKKYSWRKTAEETLAVFNEILNKK